MAAYRFLAVDAITGELRDEIPFRGVSYTETLNAPGSFSATLPTKTRKIRTVPVPYVREVMDLGPSGYWRMDDRSGTTVADAIGASDGTISGTASLVQDGAIVGDLNHAIGLGDGAAAIELPAASWGPTGTDWTIVGWIWLTRSDRESVLFSADSGSCSVRLSVTAGGAVRLATQTEILTSDAGIVPTGTWNLVAATYDHQTGTGTVYLNGFTVASGTVDAWTCGTATLGAWIGGTYNATPGAPMMVTEETVETYTIGLVGGWTVSSTPPSGGTVSSFYGTVDEVSVWNGRALHELEIIRLVLTGFGIRREITSETILRRDTLDPGRTLLYVERAGEIVWGGFLWTASVSGEEVSFGAEGIWSYYRHRIIRSRQKFTGTDQFTIVRTILNSVQSAPGSFQISVPTITSGIVRDATYYALERHNVAEVIEGLAALRNGFDFYVESRWTSGTIQNTLRLCYPRRGRRVETVFQDGVNVESLEWNVDATTQANLVALLARGEGSGTLIATATDTRLVGESYPLLEVSGSFSDVRRAATLQAKADRALSELRLPTETISLVGRGEILGAVGVGDTLRVVADYGYLSVDALKRVAEISVECGDDGGETVAVSFVDEEVALS